MFRQLTNIALRQPARVNRFCRLARWSGEAKKPEEVKTEKPESEKPESEMTLEERDPASPTSSGFVFIPKNQEATPTFDKIDASMLREEIVTERDLNIRTSNVFEPLLPISKITSMRRSRHLMTAASVSAATASYYFGHPYLAFFLCFVASGPIVDLSSMRRGLKNKVLHIRLHPDLSTVDLITAYKTITVPIKNINATEKSLLSLAKVRKGFEEMKKSNHNLEEGAPLHAHLSAVFSVVNKGRLEQMVVDLDPYLYKVDNFDLLTDILHGNSTAVAQYTKVEPS
jgi:hypothetical protein